MGTRMSRSRVLDRLWNGTVLSVAAIALIMLAVPTIIILITSFDTRNFIGFPPEGFSLDRFVALFRNESILEAAGLSLTVGAWAVVADVLLAVPAAIAIVRRDFPGKALVLGFLQMPIMLPGIVIGIALLMFISIMRLDPSVPILVAGHVVLTFPFVLSITMSRMERADLVIEEAARNLGASRLRVFTHIQLPYLMPAIAAGAAFAFLTSFDNLTISLFLTPVGDLVLPVELFFLMRFNLDPVVAAVATVQVLLTLIVLIVGLRLVGEDAILRT